ncbi:hypothetical protein KKD62_02480 [Patescibacteria group bacterium]|nr:hypothetical protein [Patescibacteria group bacterium]MBU1931592.1 hypothetical protein [Patescibacteria group bacterium]
MARLKWFYGLLITVFLILAARLIWLQLIKGQKYRLLADENRIKLEYVRADRGVIYDRYQRVLVRNAPDGREYPLGEALAHIIGFMGKLSEADWQVCQQQRQRGESCVYQLDDWLGKMGLEKTLDQQLRGQPGGILSETDAEGKVVRQISASEPIAGENIELTLDSQLQVEIQRLLGSQKGAVVVSLPTTGEILALNSSPSFQPQHPDQPGEMFNRAISGLYPPGSVFKLIPALAALEEKKITAKTLIEDTGEIIVGEYRYGNWYFNQYGQTEGELDLVGAIRRSNDIFFYRLGEWLGARKLASWARLFGLGQTTGLELSGEAAGLVPDPDWKKKVKQEAWFLGNTYHMAIGQGDLLVTPLQINVLTNTVAADGQLCRPYLLQSSQPDCHDLKLNQENLDLVKQGMKEVCQPGGTAFPFFEFQVDGQVIEIAGKTGTAEFGHPEDKTHAWFTGFAPIDQPKISITVLLEAAGEGSREAAPLAKEILEWWFKNRRD